MRESHLIEMRKISETVLKSVEKNGIKPMGNLLKSSQAMIYLVSLKLLLNKI